MNSTVNINTLCLTSDQIADLLIADDLAALSLASRRRHLEQCPTCRAEFHQLEMLLGNLRESAVASAAQASAQASQLSYGFGSRRVAVRGAMWLASAVALAVAVTFPLMRHTTAVPNGHEISIRAKSAPAGASTIADEALLDGISQDLSASVPSSMQALDDPGSKVSGQSAMDDDATRR